MKNSPHELCTHKYIERESKTGSNTVKNKGYFIHNAHSVVEDFLQFQETWRHTYTFAIHFGTGANGRYAHDGHVPVTCDTPWICGAHFPSSSRALRHLCSFPSAVRWSWRRGTKQNWRRCRGPLETISLIQALEAESTRLGGGRKPMEQQAAGLAASRSSKRRKKPLYMLFCPLLAMLCARSQGSEQSMNALSCMETASE